MFEDEAQEYIGHDDFFLIVEEQRWLTEGPEYTPRQEGGVYATMGLEVLVSACVAGPHQKLRLIKYVGKQSITSTVQLELG